MTLIITVQARSHIVVTADGLCTTTKNGIQTKTSEILQKIFPLSNKGFAIAHHGQNIIDDKGTAKVIAEEFLRDNTNAVRRTSVRQIGELFTQRYGDDIKKTLERISESKLCGFLFMGFGIDNDPDIYEVYWKKDDQDSGVPKEHTDLVLSGDAKRYIERYIDENKEYRKNHILNGAIKDAQAYCDKLYKFAEDVQTKAGEDIFGGHKHQLVIKKSGCEWLIAPKQLSPVAAGCEGLIEK
jgi:hypothetical protein